MSCKIESVEEKGGPQNLPGKKWIEGLKMRLPGSCRVLSVSVYERKSKLDNLDESGE